MRAQPSPLLDAPSRRRWATPRRRLRRAVLRHRRPLAAVLAGIAVLAALDAVRPAAAPRAEVLVAAHDLPAGAVLTADDLTPAAVPPQAEPDGAVGPADTGALVGRELAGAVRRGEPVTDVRLVGSALAAASPGRVAVPVRLPDAAQAALLQPGDRLDLLAADPQGGTAARPLTDDAVVLAAATGSADTSGATGLPGTVVVLGVDPGSVPALTQAEVTSYLTYTWHAAGES